MYESRLSPYEPVSEKKPPALERSESGTPGTKHDNW